jgi:hypothetical protein
MDAFSGAADVLGETMLRVASHPGFEAGFAHYLDCQIARLSANKQVGKAITTNARSAIIGYIVVLHFRNQAGDDRARATYGQLLDICLRRRDCGPRSLQTQLALLMVAGFLRRERGADRRERIYRPTPKLLGHVVDWWAGTLGCFDAMNGVTDYGARALADPAFVPGVLMGVSVPFLEMNVPLVEFYPLFHELMLVDRGFAVGAALVRAEMRGEPAPTAPALAKRFGGSVSQARNVLAWVERQGLEARDDRGVSGLRRLYAAYIARELALYAQFALPPAALADSGAAAT